jgi:CheY-like chemotaxis protein
VAPGLAWLVYGNADASAWTQRRLERLGWRTRSLDSVAEASAAARGGVAPDVVLVAERALDSTEHLSALRQALPRSRIALLVRPDWDQPALEHVARDNDMTVALLPLTPLALRTLLARANPEPAAQAAAPVALVPPAALHVMVAEDNVVNLMIAEEFLRQLGHRPSGAADGEALLALCEQGAPDLVLMDLQMPRMDGVEATRRLRALQASGRLPRFPIVALSAHAGAADREQALAAGMDDYLTKPVLIDALRATLERWAP